MGDLIDINEWIETKVNILAQQYQRCRGTVAGNELECILREWGHKMARYKIHNARVYKGKEDGTRIED